MIFTEEQDLLRQTVRDFAEKEIQPRVDEILESEGFIPHDLYKKMADLGVFGLLVKPEYGGSGKGMTEVAIVTEELARVSPVMGFVFTCTVLCFADYEDNAEFREKYLGRALAGDIVVSTGVSEPVGHTNVSEWKPIARREGDEYVLNGTKLFVTHSLETGVHMVYGLDENGKMCTWVIDGDAAGFSHDALDEKFGMHGSAGGTVTYKDVRVSASMCFPSEVGDGTWYNFIWHAASTVALGTVEGALDQAIDYIKVRTHDFKPIAHIQYQAERVALMKAKVLSVRSLIYDAAITFDNPETRAEGCMLAQACKGLVPSIAYEVTKECIKLHGGLGYSNKRIWHWMPDAVGMAIADNTTEYVLEQLARTIGLDTDFE